MWRATLDTNQLVSAFLYPQGKPGQILQAWREGRFVLVLSHLILAEARDVLQRQRLMKKFGYTLEMVEAYLTNLEQATDLVLGEVVVKGVSPDPDDDFILACAKEGQADYLVTGDVKHLLALKEYESIQIITATEFLNRLQDETEGG
jgi:putative PIN family toxin of toxin-antitoxin system